MFDKNKFYKLLHELDDCDKAMEELLDFEMKLTSKITNLKIKCNHDLIISYGLDLCGNKMAICLVCGSHLALDKTVDVLSKRKLNKNSIIDITDIIDVSKEFGMYSNSLGCLYLRAKEKLKTILNSGEELSLEEIKIRIINDLIMYERDLKVKRLEKVKID